MPVKSIHIVFVVIVFFSSCKWLNGEEGEPAYLNVEELELEAGNLQISSTHNLVDIWVSTSEKEIGVFNTPAVIPVLEEGESVLLYGGGIYVNGQTAVREKYFFYKEVVDTINLTPGQTYSITPTFTYKDQTIFSVLGSDNFESSVSRYKGIDDIRVVREQDESKAKEGSSFYVYDTDGGLPQLGLWSKTPFTIENNKSSAPVFLELDYRCSKDMEVGFEYTVDNVTGENVEVIFYGTDGEWRHVYIDLSNNINNLPSETLYRFFMRSNATEQGDYVGIDNVKLLHF